MLLINRKGCAVLERAEDELLGADWFAIAVPEHERELLRSGFDQLMRGSAPLVERLESAVVTQGGELRTIAWHHTVLRDADGAITGTLSSGEDVTERRAAEQQITYLAYHDPLTGLPNRTLLEEHLKLALARSRRTGAGVALLQLDLDNFKLVNDSLGHSGRRRADLPRRRAAAGGDPRAPTCSPAPAATASSCCWPTCTRTRSRSAERVAAQIGDRLAEPFMVAGAEFQVTASIGIAVCPRDAATPRSCSRTPTRRCTRPRRPRAAAGRVYAPGRPRPARAAVDGGPAAPRARGRGVRAALPADLRRRRRAGRRRGAAALARPRARRARGAGRVHPRRRGDRPDRVDRRLGHRRRVRAAGRVGGARPGPADLGQRLAAPAAPARLHRARQGAPARRAAPTRRGSPSS